MAGGKQCLVEVNFRLSLKVYWRVACPSFNLKALAQDMKEQKSAVGHCGT